MKDIRLYYYVNGSLRKWRKSKFNNLEDAKKCLSV